MKYHLELTKTALADIAKHKKSGNQKTLKKIEQLLNELMDHPRTGTRKPEELKFDLQGLYSRRINKKHRLIYCIKEKIVTVIVLSTHSHYGDK